MFTLLAAVISTKINESRVLSAAWKMRETARGGSVCEALHV